MTDRPVAISTKKCLICKDGKKNDCLHWHIDPDEGNIWVWCQGKCKRGYSIYQYCALAGLSLSEFLKQDFNFIEARPNEVQKIEWPRTFIPLFDKRAKPGVDYLSSRGIDVDDGMYYDMSRNGIVFPYYYENVFCGAQIRMIEPWIDDNGDERKIDTIPGTRLGLLFYGWNQSPLSSQIKGVIITEGAFNALAISQAMNASFGGILNNPWKCVACSGSGASKHHTDTIKELKDNGIKIILASDSDEPGLKMLKKFSDAEAITHYALTGDDEIDWNDIAKTMSKEEFATYFLGTITRV